MAALRPRITLHCLISPWLSKILNPAWRVVLPFANRHGHLHLAAACILTGLSALLEPLSARVLGDLFDIFARYGAGKLSSREFSTSASTYVNLLLALGLISWLVNATFFAFWVRSSEQQILYARIGVFRNVMRQTLPWLEQQDCGTAMLATRVHSAVHELGLSTSQTLGLVFQSVTTTALALGLAVFTAWDLALVTLSILPIALIVLYRLSSRARYHAERYHDRLSQVASISSTAIRAIATVQCFNSQEYEARKFEAAIRDATASHSRHIHFNALQVALARLVTIFMFIQGFWYGFRVYSSGKRTPNQILTAFWACLIAAKSIEQILPRLTLLGRRAVAATELKSLMDPPCTKQICKLRPDTLSGNISIEGVSFSYAGRSENHVLRDIRMVIPADEITFIVGKSGSGKSTLAKLILSDYQAEFGSILLDENRIDELDPEWIRQNITLIDHEPTIFNDTLCQNILAAGDSDKIALQEEFREAIRFAGLGSVISSLTDGERTYLGNGGTALSLGERQRVALARARLRNPSVLILDEATSALDVASRSLIMEKLRKWRQDRTTIVITHDTAQIMDTDYVYHIDGGRIIGEGFWSLLCPQVTGEQRKPASNSEDFRLAMNSKPQKPWLKVQHHEMKPQPMQTWHDSEDGAYITADDDLSDYSAYSISASPVEASTLGSTISADYCHSSSTSIMGARRIPELAIDVQVPVKTERPTNSCSPESFPTGDSPLCSMAIQPRRSTAVNYSQIARPRLPSTSQSRRTYSLYDIASTIWPSLGSYNQLRLLGGGISTVVYAWATPTFAYSFAKLLAAFELPQNQREEHIMIWIPILVLVAIVDSASAYLSRCLLESAAESWINQIRTGVFRRVLNQPYTWFDSLDERANECASCLLDDAEELRDLIGRFAAFGIAAACMLVTAFSWSIFLCWRLATLGILATFLLYLLSGAFEHSCRAWEMRANDASVATTAIFSEGMSNLKTVRGLGLQPRFLHRYSIATRKALNIGLRRAYVLGGFIGALDASMIFTQALIFWYGARLATSGGVPVDTLITVFSMLLFSISSASVMVSHVPQVGSSQAAASRLLALARLPWPSMDRSSVRITEIHGPISFRNLRLRYPSQPSTEALGPLSFDIPLRASTALVGPSGAGKTSAVSALLGLYRDAAGDASLMIGSTPLSRIDIPSLRAVIGYVPQQVVVFPDTIAANIAYGLNSSDPRATPFAIETAARQAGIDIFIDSLADGYQTAIGVGGLGLSAGQIQRIGIARALLRRPQLLLMDEPTSNLDQHAANHVRDTIRGLTATGTTVVVTTHSRELMRAMDRLVVLDGGQAAEEGSWKELLRQSSRFRRWMESEELGQ